MSDTLSRRHFLTRAGLIGCSLAASPLVTPISFAAAPWDTRLVVIILRGGMDGLDVVRPVGDPDYAALRPNLQNGPLLMLDNQFALHPALSDLLPLWKTQQLGFVHAVSTPYRDKRSHFDGQDLLEAGTEGLDGTARDGWLNRMLQQIPGIKTDTAYAIGTGEMSLLSGAAPVANWSPETDLGLSPQAMRLAELVMEDDPALHAAFTEAMMLSEGIAESDKPKERRGYMQIARFAAERLRDDARVAAFSLNGWDTHSAQDRSLGRSLSALSETLLAIKQDLGPKIWGKTAVVAMTEFGRTARQNGSGGTDHGTGSAMLFAGGALKGGKVYGQWPGLAEADLYDRRDLLPTADVRTQAAWVMRSLIGLDRAILEDHVFPGIDLGPKPGFIY